MTTNTATSRKLNIQTAGLWAFFLLALVIALRLLLVPDPGGKLLLARAQRLEGVGMMDQALRQYALLATTHPDSPYAPQALQREGDILIQKARAGDTARFQEAIAVYRHLADTYPQNTLAGQALLSIGALYMVDLHDNEHAKATYEEVLKSYPNNAEFASEATLQLGRVAFAARSGKDAQTWLQRVLQRYSSFPERCAEAQYHLGETYETLFKNKETARNAYEAAMKNYPQSIWAGNARERLALLLYGDVAPRARRVLITVPASLPATDSSSIDAAMLTLLAARGLNIGETTLRGWSMEPFFAGIVPSDPGRALSLPFQGWENSASNAGLRYSIISGEPKTALSDLQHELDDARLTLLYNGGWHLASGYDSQRNQVFLQGGSGEQKIATSELARTWNRSSAIGGAFSLVSFNAPGEDEKARPGPAPVISGRLNEKGAPAPQGEASGTLPGAQVTRVISPLETPTYVYELKTLSEKSGHRRALRQAAEWMKRGQSGSALINAEALRYLSNETRRLSLPPGQVDRAAGAAAPGADGADTPVRAENAAGANADGAPKADGAVTPAPVSTPIAPATTPAPGELNLAGARALLAWKGAPLQQWLGARRAAAAYLDIASVRLKDNSLRQAADSLRAELSALENAAAYLPAANTLAGPDGALSEASRLAFANASTEFENARAADSHAADLIAAAGG